MPFCHDHVALTVKDLEASRAFYEYLGGQVVSRPSPRFVEIVLGEIRLHLLPGGNAKDVAPKAPRIDHLCLRVGTLADLGEVEARLNAYPLFAGRRRCEVEDSPPMGAGDHCEERPPQKTLYFEDPDGIRLEVRAYS